MNNRNLFFFLFFFYHVGVICSVIYDLVGLTSTCSAPLTSDWLRKKCLTVLLSLLADGRVNIPKLTLPRAKASVQLSLIVTRECPSLRRWMNTVCTFVRVFRGIAGELLKLSLTLLSLSNTVRDRLAGSPWYAKGQMGLSGLATHAS